MELYTILSQNRKYRWISFYFVTTCIVPTEIEKEWTKINASKGSEQPTWLMKYYTITHYITLMIMLAVNFRQFKIRGSFCTDCKLHNFFCQNGWYYSALDYKPIFYFLFVNQDDHSYLVFFSAFYHFFVTIPLGGQFIAELGDSSTVEYKSLAKMAKDKVSCLWVSE